MMITIIRKQRPVLPGELLTSATFNHA